MALSYSYRKSWTQVNNYQSNKNDLWKIINLISAFKYYGTTTASLFEINLSGAQRGAIIK